ncbi:MAG: hypothetical protein WC516_03075 [Patescibacteria group bacterium]
MFLLNCLIWLGVQLALMALCLAPLGLALLCGCNSVIDWYGRRYGNLSASPRSNWWAAVFTVGFIAVNIQAMIAYDINPFKSPLVAGIQQLTQGDEKHDELTDGHTLERLAGLLDGGQPADKPDFSAFGKSVKPKSAGASVIWGMMAVLSWPVWLLLMLFIFSDDFCASIAAGLSRFLQKKSATATGESEVGAAGGGSSGGGTSSAHHGHGPMSWVKWLLALFGIEVGVEVITKMAMKALESRRV